MSVLIKKGYKYRLYPTEEQALYLNQILGACRKLWNILLDESIKEYEVWKADNKLPKPSINVYNLINKIPSIKEREELSWMKDYPSVALQQKASDLAMSYQNLFNKKKGFPKFKSRFGKNSFRLVQFGFSVCNDQLKIAKLETPLKIQLHRPLPSKPSSCTISKTPSGEYYVSFVCNAFPKVTNGKDLIGIDLGLKDLIVTSDNVKIENPKTYQKHQKKLTAAQRAMSHKVKGSNNRNKARLKVARTHQKISNIRKDWITKTCRKLVNRSRAIVIEDLNVAGMVRNPHLSKSLMDASLGQIRQTLTQMTAESNWCNLVIADRWFPSTQLCSCCKKKPDIKIKLSERSWTCLHCGTKHDRDHNASVNLKQLTDQDWVKDLIEKFPGRLIDFSEIAKLGPQKHQ